MHAFTFAYKSLLVVVPFTDCMELPPQFQILWVFLGRPVAGLCCQGCRSDFRHWWGHSQSTLALIYKSQAYGEASHLTPMNCWHNVTIIQLLLVDMEHSSMVQHHLCHCGSDPCFKFPQSAETLFCLWQWYRDDYQKPLDGFLLDQIGPWPQLASLSWDQPHLWWTEFCI